MRSDGHELEVLWEHARQHQLFLVPPTVACERRLQRLCALGHWIKVFPRMYAPADWWNHTPLLWRYKVLVRTYISKHPQAVLAGVSALVAYNFPVSEKELAGFTVHIACPAERASASSKQVKRTLVARLSTCINKLKTCSALCPERLVIDRIRTSTFTQAVGFLYDACTTGLTSLEKIHAFLAQHPGINGIRNVRVALHYLMLDADNAGEAKIAATIMHRGFARPQAQQTFFNPRNPDCPFRSDFSWKLANGRLAILELDGIQAKRVEQARSDQAAAMALQHEIERAHSFIELGAQYIRHITYDIINRPYELDALLEAMEIPRKQVPKRWQYIYKRS